MFKTIIALERFITLFFLQNFCLSVTGTRNIPEMETALTELPGQRFTAHEQCQLFFGSESFYCGVGIPINNVIRRFLVHSDTNYRPIESSVSHLCRI